MSEGAQSWDYPSHGPLSLEAVRRVHRPGERFRISPARHHPGESFSEISRAGRRYVLAGSCSFTQGNFVWELRAGQFADLPEGPFEFRVLDAGPAELVRVWELPPGFWSGQAEQGAVPDRGGM
ncbi:hypothetical protein [Zavarzinella formosa]|uniref:hypothetical protein n=1 Tax=Zavarzinella formosa TaxID=360055 RepID=UPI000314803F|nr:hypothetical protein [Zavarzinella formosa]